jgi:hypothetical protein
MMSRHLVERDMRGSVMQDSLIHPIRADYLSGMSYVAIGQKYGIDQRTAKRYAFHNLPMDNLQQRPFQSKMDDFRLPY